MKGYIAEIGQERIKIEFPAGQEGRAVFDGRPAAISHAWIGGTGHNLHLIIDGRSYDFRVEEEDGQLALTYVGKRFHCSIYDERVAELKRRANAADRPAGRTVVKAPMPGLVVKLMVEVGAQVQKGDRILVLEAMKMENDVKAPRAGRVSSIAVAAGQAVVGGRELAVIE
jgi:biotin carboxyl carrier protein